MAKMAEIYERFVIGEYAPTLQHVINARSEYIKWFGYKPTTIRLGIKAEKQLFKLFTDSLASTYDRVLGMKIEQVSNLAPDEWRVGESNTTIKFLGKQA